MITNEEVLFCIRKINPAAKFAVCCDGDRISIQWHELHEGSRPTLEDCEAVLGEVQPEIEKEKQSLLRKQAYREESDSLKFKIEEDAMISGGPPDYTPWLQKKAEIRARYPYPFPEPGESTARRDNPLP